MTENQINARVQQFEGWLYHNGHKQTRPRSAVARTFFGAGERINVQEVFRRVRKTNKRIGYATVYRTMQLLAESGLVVKHDPVQPSHTFEAV